MPLTERTKRGGEVMLQEKRGGRGRESEMLVGTNALCVWGSYVVLSALDFIFILKVVCCLP
eukprot:388799-Hanusia_phi.AAC.2